MEEGEISWGEKVYTEGCQETVKEKRKFSSKTICNRTTNALITTSNEHKTSVALRSMA